MGPEACDPSCGLGEFLLEPVGGEPEAGRLQAPHRRPARGARGPGPAQAGGDPPGRRGDRPPGHQLARRRPRTAAPQQEAGLAHHLEEQPGQGRQCPPGTGRDDPGVDRVAAPVPPQPVPRRAATAPGRAPPQQRVTRADAGLEGGDVLASGSGHDDHPMPRGPHPATQVDVVTDERDRGIEGTDRLHDVPAEQGTGGGDGQHVRPRVVLALVPLAGGEPGHAPAGRRHRHPDLDEGGRVVPGHELAARDGHRGSRDHRAEEHLQRVRRRGRVVVDDPHQELDPPGATPRRRHPRCGQHLTGTRHADRDGLPGRRRPRQRDHGGHLRRGGEEVTAAVDRAGVHGDQDVGTPGGADQCGEGPRQPPGAVVGDEDREDRDGVGIRWVDDLGWAGQERSAVLRGAPGPHPGTGSALGRPPARAPPAGTGWLDDRRAGHIPLAAPCPAPGPVTVIRRASSDGAARAR